MDEIRSGRELKIDRVEYSNSDLDSMLDLDSMPLTPKNTHASNF